MAFSHAREVLRGLPCFFLAVSFMALSKLNKLDDVHPNQSSDSLSVGLARIIPLAFYST